MRPVGKLELFRTAQPLVGFVHQRRRLQRVPLPLGRHFAGRDRPQLGINLVVNLVEGLGIAPGRLFQLTAPPVPGTPARFFRLRSP